MNREVYQKNLESIRNKYESWVNLIEKKSSCLEPKIKVETECARTGECIFRVSQDGKVLYLNGKYNPQYAGMDWLKEVGKIENFATIIIIGIHDGIHIRNILQNVKKTNNILIYEPSFEIFRKALEEVDLSFLFQKDIPVGLIISGINEDEKEAYLSVMMNYDNMTMLQVYSSENYNKLFPEEIKDFIKKIKRYVGKEVVHWNTLAYFTHVNAKNVFHNCRYMYEGYSSHSLCNMLTSDIPTIVVSAGPSLNKNIQDLKEAVGKANIIATDTAMKPLLNAGIIPNLFVVVDGLKPAVLFDHKDISKIPMVTKNDVSIESMKMHKGKKIFSVGSFAFEKEIAIRVSKTDKEFVNLMFLDNGGSVATSAFTLGVLMGSKTIILMGQDLAMTGNRTHADGTFQDKMDEIDVNSSRYFPIESVDGNMVLTRSDYKGFLDWFEEQIKKRSEIRVIDATEGGAKIHGAEIMTLKEAIKDTCKREFDVNSKIAKIPQMFGEKGKEEFLNLLEETDEKLIEVKKKANIGIRYYEKLEKLSKKKKYSNVELEKLLKKIGKINEYIETDYMANIVNDSLKDIERVVRKSIYRTKEDTKEEMLDIAQNGQIMLRAMRDKTDEIMRLAEEMIDPFVKSKREEIIKKVQNK